MTQPLPTWATELLAALEIDPVDVDLGALQVLSHHLEEEPREAGVLVGFIAGYAAGLAQGGQMASFERAHRASIQFMRQHLTRE